MLENASSIQSVYSTEEGKEASLAGILDKRVGRAVCGSWRAKMTASENEAGRGAWVKRRM